MFVLSKLATSSFAMARLELRCSELDRAVLQLNEISKHVWPTKNAIYMLVFFSFLLCITQATCNIQFLSTVGEERLKKDHQSCNLGHLATGHGPAPLPPKLPSGFSLVNGHWPVAPLHSGSGTWDLCFVIGTWDLGSGIMASNSIAVYRKQSMYQEKHQEYKKELLHECCFQALSSGAASTSAC